MAKTKIGYVNLQNQVTCNCFPQFSYLLISWCIHYKKSQEPQTQTANDADSFSLSHAPFQVP